MTAYEMETVPEIGRRRLLKAAVAGAGATVAGVAASAPVRSAQAAVVVQRKRILYGAMHSIYPSWVTNAPSPGQKNSERRFFDAVNLIPKDWTTAACNSNYVTISIRPNPDDLLTGNTIPDNGSGFTTLDGQITHFLGTCPTGVELTCWHEAQNGNPRHYPANITIANIQAIHDHVQKICSSTPTADGGRVGYGCILTGPVGTNAEWLGRGLDWYGIDIYDGPHFQYPNGNLNRDAITGRMHRNVYSWLAAAGRPTVTFRITETNSANNNHRKNWMLWLSQWMAENHGKRMITFWGGPASGTWPPSQAVLDYYRTLQDLYGA